jgi:hypothetical protein
VWVCLARLSFEKVPRQRRAKPQATIPTVFYLPIQLIIRSRKPITKSKA